MYILYMKSMYICTYSLIQSPSQTTPTSTPPPVTPSDPLLSFGRAAARKARSKLHTLINQLRPPDDDGGETPPPVATETDSPNDVPMETEPTNNISTEKDPVAGGDDSAPKQPPSKSPSVRVRQKTDWGQSAVTQEEMKVLRRTFVEGSEPVNCPVKVGGA